ncbi:VOC family protein [Naasia aerilata]|uniref:Methylmalonyl-CoA epimerase n=1 Tax=Naasia aerilata TaxID=1162966 RepID=A0ABM8GD37_9MICO|nr:VOC family protein [Naasia aerilata]BDZ46171.1 methylmalonyl-CoA epimerase [Naasia aerilata]
MLNEEKQHEPGEAPAQVLGLDHVGVMVPDLDAGIRWYETVLGMHLRDRWANENVGMEWAHLSLGALTVELVKRPGLTPPSDVPAAGYHHLALCVEDCAATVERLQASGVEVLFSTSHFDRHDMDWAFVEDGFGNVIEILSYRSLPSSDG